MKDIQLINSPIISFKARSHFAIFTSCMSEDLTHAPPASSPPCDQPKPYQSHKVHHYSPSAEAKQSRFFNLNHRSKTNLLQFAEVNLIKPAKNRLQLIDILKLLVRFN